MTVYDYRVKFPEILRIEPSSSCNFQCIHCPTGLGLNQSLGIMSEKTFEKIYEQIKDHKFRVIVLYHGGEPFLNKKFFQMASKLKPLTARLRTTTNGSLLNDELIEQILEFEFDEIDISLDGVSSEENNLIRIGSNYDVISENIIKLIKLRNKRNLKKPKITIANAQVPRDLETLEKANVPHHMLETFKEVLDDIEFKPFYTIQWPGMPENNVVEKPAGNYCDHVLSTFSIRWNGDVVPCCYDLVNMMVMGNVLNEKIDDIWNNNKFLKLRKDIHEFNPPDLCKNCLVLCGIKSRTNSFGKI